MLLLGSFTNSIDKILTFFDHLPPCVYIFYGINVDKKWTFLTTYLPRLVNVVCERPLSNCNLFSVGKEMQLWCTDLTPRRLTLVIMIRHFNVSRNNKYVKMKEFSYWKIKKGHLKKRDVGLQCSQVN